MPFAVIEIIEPGTVAGDLWCDRCQTDCNCSAQIWAFTMQCLINVGAFTECRVCRRNAEFQCATCLARMAFDAVIVSAHIRTHYPTVMR